MDSHPITVSLLVETLLDDVTIILTFALNFLLVLQVMCEKSFVQFKNHEVTYVNQR